MTNMCSRRALAAGMAAGVLSFFTAGCSGDALRGSEGAAPGGSSPWQGEPLVRVASLKGPTSMGLIPFMQRAGAGKTAASYEFEISTSADQIVPRLIKGEVDVALLPANLASVLYHKTQGAVRALDINTLGVLHVVTADSSVAAFDDLAGRTVYLTGKGAVPEYVTRHLLECSGLGDLVSLDFKSEPAEVVSILLSDPAAVAILPEPFVTVARVKSASLLAPIALEDVWAHFAGKDGSRLITGVTVVRSDFAERYPDAVTDFMEEHAASAESVVDHPEAWAQSVVDAGIIDSAEVARQAIPGCGIACIHGVELEAALSGYLKVLYDADSASVGGDLPAGDFYL